MRIKSLIVALTLVAASPAFASDSPTVTGIGGLFFKAENPTELALWYEKHFNISRTPTTYETEPWKQQAGPTVFAPFSQLSEYFGDKEQQWMLNLRVTNIETLITNLRAADIDVSDTETFPNGTFARLSDPEGNPIQLWESKDPTMKVIEGKFEVSITPAEGDTHDVGRMLIEKRYSGGLEADAFGQMLSQRQPGDTNAVYVALEHVQGKLEGMEGGFSLVHNGKIKNGENSLNIEISPGSGTGDLQGISGYMDIEITDAGHFYTLHYKFTR